MFYFVYDSRIQKKKHTLLILRRNSDKHDEITYTLRKTGI